MESYCKKMLLQSVAIISIIILVRGNSMTGNFQVCNLQCSNDESASHPISNQSPPTTSFLRGKSGPRGAKGARGEAGTKGEAGTSDRHLIVQLQNRISKLESDLTNKISSDAIIPINKLKLCGVGLQLDPSPPAISNSQITASSYRSNNYDPFHGRLFAKTGNGCWASGSVRANEWIQVDLEEDKTIHAVATQGRQRDYPQWVTSYNIMYQVDGANNFQTILDQSGTAVVFEGNTDMETPVMNRFPQPISARYFRINVLTWHSHISLRFDLFAC